MTVARPILLICASFVIGMYLVAIFGINASFTVIFCALLTLLICTFKTKRLAKNVVLYISFVTFVSGICMYITTSDASYRSAYTYCGEEVQIKGEVLDDVIESSDYVRFELKTEKIDGTKCEEKLSLIYFKKPDDNFTVPKTGDVIESLCAISVPDGAMNTGGFSYASYLMTQKIYFSGVCDGETLSVVGHNDHLIKDNVRKFRNKCLSFFENSFPQKEGAILKAYIVGDKNSLSEDESEIFSASGLSHVLAVSGMHVVIFISCLVSFLELIKVSKQKQRILSAIAVIFFVMFTGASTSSIRAAAMSFIAIYAKYIFKRSDSLTSLFFVAACFCFINPQIIFEASFMLSFGATFGILVFADRLMENFTKLYLNIKSRRIRGFVRDIISLICVGISAQILTIPILVYLFKGFSSVSAIATLVVTPILTPMLVGGLLFTFTSFINSQIAHFFAGFTYLCAKSLNFISEFFADFSFSKVPFGMITPFIVMSYIIFLAIFYFILIHKSKVGYFTTLYSLVFLSLVYLGYSTSLINDAKVTFINVGEGDCSLISAYGNCDILIDSGGKEKDYSIAENTVKPYLLQNGVKDIDFAIATHGHEDHVNGIIGLLDCFKVKNIIVPYGFGTTDAGGLLLEKAEEKGVPVIKIKHGNVLKINDDMKLTAVMPDDKIINFTADDEENERSLVLKLSHGENTFLFTGDITSYSENYSVSKYKDLLDADVLKIAHHGSKYSTTDEFLKTVSPDFAYIPTGKNMYGHPHNDVLERLKNNGTVYYRADMERDVTFYFDTEKIYGIKYSQRNGR